MGMLSIKQLSIKHRRRLLALALFLERFKPTRGRRFHMGHLGLHRGAHPPGRLRGCGTSACALGWAGFVPSLRRAGLRTSWRPKSSIVDGRVIYYILRVDYGRARTDYYDMYDVATRFFGLTRERAVLAFGTTRRTAKQEARLLRTLVAERR